MFRLKKIYIWMHFVDKYILKCPKYLFNPVLMENNFFFFFLHSHVMIKWTMKISNFECVKIK